MMGSSGWIVVAIVLAVIDAICFAAAAVYQQRAVRRTVLSDLPTTGADQRFGSSTGHIRQHRLSLRRIPTLVSKPGWLGGAALMVLGGSLHVIALWLAPVSVIQPIGVLGVPIAVLLAAKLAHRRPSRRSVLPILLCVVSIGAFVGIAAEQVSTDRPVPMTGLLITEAVVLLVIGSTILITRRMHGWIRCLSNAVAGALGVGMVAVLMRALGQHLQAGSGGIDLGRLFDPAGSAMIGLMILSGAAGGWLVQQAYASGPAEVVLASLTVVDPMIAVVIGLLLLGEGATLTAGATIGMIICGLAAVGGVIALARTHPDAEASPRRQELDIAVHETAEESDRLVRAGAGIG
ncbi:hypothetical protein FOE78_09395 [Microlunatus elymi]|uniref:Magnesium transporter NIPA n=1 Tax=Microlunatus elymi TaxID=2596828 RepID=A0A516PY33_9ACTN|nr:hypothetical protein [Microlunatus elymi]QDP96083.1 hypothetical protein FOE78_09395 [Microlunatus elymi]